MALKNYKNDPSMNAITERMKILGKFTLSFNFISHDVQQKNLIS